MLISRKPAAPLCAFIDTLWAAERSAMPHARERNLPTGRVDIVIPLLEGQTISRYAGPDDARGTHFREGVVQGAHDSATLRDTGAASSVVGVHFRPGGAAPFFGGAVPELSGLTVPLDALWGPSARWLREDLQATASLHGRLLRLEAWLLAHLQNTQASRAMQAVNAMSRHLTPGHGPDAMVSAALRALQRNPACARIDPVQRASGCGPTQFIARFERSVGLTPKRYARVLRFHTLVEQLAGQPRIDWAQAAADAGYADQAHLTREFRRLAGITPTDYQAVAADQPTHVAVRR